MSIYDYGPDSGGRTKVKHCTNNLISLFNIIFFHSGPDCKAYHLWQCSQILWKEAGRRWTHASVDGLRPTL